MRSNFLLRLPKILAASVKWLFLCFLELERTPEVILASYFRWQAASFPQLQVAKQRLGPEPRLQHNTFPHRGRSWATALRNLCPCHCVHLLLLRRVVLNLMVCHPLGQGVGVTYQIPYISAILLQFLTVAKLKS